MVLPRYRTPSKYENTRGPLVTRFAESLLTVPKGPRVGQPLRYLNWQRWLLNEVLEVRDDNLCATGEVLSGSPGRMESRSSAPASASSTCSAPLPAGGLFVRRGSEPRAVRLWRSQTPGPRQRDTVETGQGIPGHDRGLSDRQRRTGFSRRMPSSPRASPHHWSSSTRFMSSPTRDLWDTDDDGNRGQGATASPRDHYGWRRPGELPAGSCTSTA